MKTPSIVWFRNDLRLNDNLALAAAAELGSSILPVFIWSPDDYGSFPPGAASRWWLHNSLMDLSESFRKRYKSHLVIRQGSELDSILKLVTETGAKHVFFNARYEPDLRKSDKTIVDALESTGVSVDVCCSTLLHNPTQLLTAEERPYKVFTPFWKSLQKRKIRQPVKLSGAKFIPASYLPTSLEVSKLGLLPKIHWTQGMEKEWQPGEDGANKRLKEFLESAVADYKEGRDTPGKALVSKMSPHLHFGEISPNTIWYAAQSAMLENASCASGCESYLRELVWREFAYHLLYHFSETTREPLRKQFNHFPWRSDSDLLKAWQNGKTGYPIVDAGMRELWQLGWMHNRVRMIVASFLVKHLLISWQEGADWFWDTLVDADLANNTLGWQWTAGCGADAAPYFRIFNPTLQGEKFDPDGDYVKRWVPELKNLNAKWIHRPWDAPPAELSKAGVDLGTTYPHPVVDHAKARARALAAFETIKAGAVD